MDVRALAELSELFSFFDIFDCNYHLFYLPSDDSKIEKDR